MISRPIRLVFRGVPQPHSAYKYKVVVSTLITHLSHSKTLATTSLIAKGTGGVWKAKHSRLAPEGRRFAAASPTPTRTPTSSTDQA